MTLHRLSRRGQIVIPKEAREKLGIQPGDWVFIEIEDDRLVVRRPTPGELLEESLRNYRAGKTLTHEETFRDLV